MGWKAAAVSPCARHEEGMAGCKAEFLRHLVSGYDHADAGEVGNGLFLHLRTCVTVAARLHLGSGHEVRVAG